MGVGPSLKCVTRVGRVPWAGPWGTDSPGGRWRLLGPGFPRVPSSCASSRLDTRTTGPLAWPPPGPLAAHEPFLNPTPLAGAPQPPTSSPRPPGWPPHFRLGPWAPRNPSAATRLAGPAALKLQLPASSARACRRAAERWAVPRAARERGGACASARGGVGIARARDEASKCEGKRWSVCGCEVRWRPTVGRLRDPASPGDAGLGIPRFSVAGVGLGWAW